MPGGQGCLAMAQGLARLGGLPGRHRLHGRLRVAAAVDGFRELRQGGRQRRTGTTGPRYFLKLTKPGQGSSRRVKTSQVGTRSDPSRAAPFSILKETGFVALCGLRGEEVGRGYRRQPAAWPGSESSRTGSSRSGGGGSGRLPPGPAWRAAPGPRSGPSRVHQDRCSGTRLVDSLVARAALFRAKVIMVSQGTWRRWDPGRVPAARPRKSPGPAGRFVGGGPQHPQRRDQALHLLKGQLRLGTRTPGPRGSAFFLRCGSLLQAVRHVHVEVDCTPARARG